MRSQRLGVNSALSIARYLPAKSKLRAIDLHENVIRDKGAVAIIKELFFSSTSDLISMNVLPSEFADRITSIDFGSNDIGNEGLRVLCRALQFPQVRLRRLILGSELSELHTNRFDHNSVLELASAIELNSTLEELDLRRCSHIGKKSQEAFRALSKAFERNKSLTSISLYETNMSTDSGSRILTALTNNPKLRYLDIGSNGLEPEIVPSIASLLMKPGVCLTTLILKKNYLLSTGIRVLCDGLRENKTIAVLDVEENDLGNDGITQIADLLTKSKNIITLNLRNNGITPEGIINFFVALRQNKTLATLNISKNKVQDEGAKEIATTLEK